ncbi:MAG: hypothetical protein LBD12_02205, partial [Clostridiales Family XIII bacterium]|nr:hypothetical protein [Clostridiales Family XIII bacterium]
MRGATWKRIPARGGSVAVFLTISFAVVMLLAACLFAATQAAAGKSCADAAYRLAGRSVLSTYDRELLDRYGLLAFKGEERGIARDIAFYANAGLLRDNRLRYPLLVNMEKRARFFDMEVDDNEIEVNLKGFSIMDADRFEAQVKEAALGRFLEKKRNSRTQKKTGSKTDGVGDKPKEGERTLRNRSVLESLPSKGMDGFSLPQIRLSDLPSLPEIASEVGTRALTDLYITSVFGRAYDGHVEEDSFFDTEVEYIIAGKKSDAG